jgi:Xaa-Pro aminopeptidase
MQTREKLAALRALMKKSRLDAYYIPSVDPHQSEYVPACWQRRGWLSGFDGSAGDLLVTARWAGLWTDSRYFLQAEMQLADSGFDLMRIGDPDVTSLEAHAAGMMRRGQVLGIDPRVMSIAKAAGFEKALSAKGVKVKYLARNLVDTLWDDQPKPSPAPVVTHSRRYAGESAASKLKRLRAKMADLGAKAHVIGALDVIAWLFNIRSQDIDHTPVAISYAVVTGRDATLFVDPAKVTPALRKALRGVIKLKPYGDIADRLRQLAARRQSVLIDPSTTNQWIVGLLKGATLIHEESPVVAMKAIKNATAIKGTKSAHVRDGAAMVKFLKWLEEAVPAGGVTEISAAEKLSSFRAEQPLFKDTSFATISGYAGNGAIIHYSATPETSAKLKPRGIYLVDSGGQYLDGTTDITRTVPLGPFPKRAGKMFTLVLKGVIALTATPFPAGMSGQRLEILARQALMCHGVNYGHGTGHGVGHYLGVHEGPMSIGPRDVANVPLEPGQLMSNEPGHYEAGKFGIRIENLGFVVRDEKLSGPGGEWLTWDVVTLCPISLELVDRDLMAPDEIKWLNGYHKRVYRELSPLLDGGHKKWLKKATRAI